MRLRLDPYMASSLLQKAIRRGETDLARYAATVLHRYRGAAIWNRLMTIAVEDIGIADLDLLLEVARLGTDKALRSVLASDGELIQDLTARLASSPKDRCADYLHSAAVWKMSTDRAADLFAPDLARRGVEIGEERQLVCEAAHLLLRCTTSRGARTVIDEEAARQVFSEGTYAPSAIMEELLERFARSRLHPFSLMILPLWSALSKISAKPGIREHHLPMAEYIRGVPAYTWDKHTAAGKNAISRFAWENADMKRVLSRWVAESQRIPVAEIAAFYADAVPVSLKLQWSSSEALEELGCRADIMMAGCIFDGIQAVLQVTRDNLEDLNAHRRRVHGA